MTKQEESGFERNSTHNSSSFKEDSLCKENGPIGENDTKPKRNWRHVCILAILSYMNFWGAACVSLQAPFFPKEAEDKGATPTQYGFVFGIFELAVVIMSPVYGRLMPHVTPKLILLTGMIVEGISCAVFGVLDQVPDGTPFIALAFVIRVIEGCGSAALMTASFTIIASEFPTAVATTFSLMETAFGFGLIVGPTIGGALYEVGGFLLPFVVCGACLFFGSAFGFFLPSVEKVESPPPRNLKGFLMDCGTLTSALTIVTSLLVIGFNVATLEPHLRKFNLKPVILGTIFTITGGIYAFTSPIWGRFCDRGANPYAVTVIGYVFVSIGLVFIGPFPFMPFEPKLWIVITSLVVIGLGLAAKLVASFVGCLQHTLDRGFPENLGTFGMVSALFASSCSLGAFIGPSIGGLLLDTTGYEMGTVVIFAEEVFFMAVVIAYVVTEWRRKRSENHEKDPLIRRRSRRDTAELSSSTCCPNAIH